MEALDCVVVGAGLSGLAAARHYRCLRPDDSLAILEAQASLGGTWADERLFPGLKTNNLAGTYEFPDFPMDARFGVGPGEHIPGAVVHAYLEAYAVHFGIHGLIRLRSKVAAAEHHAAGGWTLTVDGRGRLFARRLIVATGLTSEPQPPRFDGQETFGRLFHPRHFGQNTDTLAAKSVTVVGGSKYAWDAVHAYVRHGADVDWVIRSSGHGPCWMAPPHVTPLGLRLDTLVHRRFLTWFSPCVWGDADGFPRIRRLIHGTAPGRLLADCFWRLVKADIARRNDYDAHPNTSKLKPWIDLMYAGNTFSFLNYDDDFLRLVKGDRVRVHVADVDRLGPGTVHLADGTRLRSDALVAHTGWRQGPPIRFLPDGIDKELGVPHAWDETDRLDALRRADGDILARFPGLRDAPEWDKDPPATTPFMLYRFMVPPSEALLRTRDVAFAGFVGTFSTPIVAHLQGLWIAAYLSGLLDNDPARMPQQALQYETVLHNRFGKWRHPIDWGNRAPSFVFDAMPYFDLLQRDLGLDPHRKRGLSELWRLYWPRDFCTLSSDWQRSRNGSLST